MGNAVLPERDHPFKTGGQKIPVGLKIAPSVAKVADLVYAQIMKWTVWGAQDLLKSNLRGSDKGEGRELALFNRYMPHPLWPHSPCGSLPIEWSAASPSTSLGWASQLFALLGGRPTVDATVFVYVNITHTFDHTYNCVEDSWGMLRACWGLWLSDCDGFSGEACHGFWGWAQIWLYTQRQSRFCEIKMLKMFKAGVLLHHGQIHTTLCSSAFCNCLHSFF